MAQSEAAQSEVVLSEAEGSLRSPPSNSIVIPNRFSGEESALSGTPVQTGLGRNLYNMRVAPPFRPLLAKGGRVAHSSPILA